MSIFRYIATYIFRNLTPITKCFNKEREKNNTCIMTIIKIFLSLDFSRSTSIKPTSIDALKIVVFRGEVIETSMAAVFLKTSYLLKHLQLFEKYLGSNWMFLNMGINLLNSLYGT